MMLMVSEMKMETEQLIFETTSSAVNHIDITNAATGSGAQIGSVGDDSNINLKV